MARDVGGHAFERLAEEGEKGGDLNQTTGGEAVHPAIKQEAPADEGFGAGDAFEFPREGGDGAQYGRNYEGCHKQTNGEAADFGVHGGDGGVGRDGGVSVGHEENRKSGFPGHGVGVFGEGHAGEKQITEKCDGKHNGQTAESRVAPKPGKRDAKKHDGG